ncbi:tail fiber domain-containing protein, partial [Candidatus Kaiserbacteria bacterium]|nr:tail fiber domain-containing protein [Candidatus Kaiserbacteria bacterium]
QMLAQNIGTQNTALANLMNIQGSTISDLYGGYGSNLAALLQGAGQGVSGLDTSLAGILANIATGQGSQAGGLPGIPGAQQGTSTLQKISSAAGGLGGLAMGLSAFFSDMRLKTNIQQTGSTIGGRNWYKWDWLIDTDQPAFGVIAQENTDVADVGPDGFLRVDYSRVS